MSQTTLVRGARQLLTLRGRRGPRRGTEMRQLALIPDGAILIRDGIIVEVGPARRVENLSSARHAEVLDAHRRVVMPAFIDQQIARAAHPYESETHLARTQSAGRLQTRWQRPLRAAARHGTGTMVLHWNYQDDVPTDSKALRAFEGLREEGSDVLTGLILDQGQAHGLDLDRLADRKLIHTAVAVCRVPAASSPAEALLRNAHGLGLTTHLRATSQCGVAPETMQFVNVLSAEGGSHMRIPHGVPTIGLATGSNWSGAREWVNESSPLALATFYDRNAPGSYSMQWMIYLCATEMGMTVEDAVVAATINAAYAAGVGDRTGSLEPGKDGDLLIMEMSDYREFLSCPGVNSVVGMIKKGVPVE